MSQEQPAVGTIVEVLETGQAKGQFAVVVEPDADQGFGLEHGERVWVRYDNGCVAPVREHWVHTPTIQQVLSILNDRL